METTEQYAIYPIMLPFKGAAKLFMGLVLLASATLVSAIYPSDHWDYSTQLTEANFDSTIQGHIDAGKTVFVRWIASAG